MFRVSVFIFTTYTISWGIWFILPLGYAIYGMFAPAFVAFAMTAYHGGFKDLFQFCEKRWIFYGFSISLVAFIIYLFLAFCFGLFEFSLPSHCTQIVFSIAMYGFLMTLGQEIGWCSYLLPKVAGMGFVLSGLFVGFVCGIYFVPYVLLTGTSVFYIFMFVVSICLSSIMYSYMYDKSNSVLPAVISSFTTVTLYDLAYMLTSRYDINDLLLSVLGYILLMLIVYVINSKKQVKEGSIDY